MSVRAQEMAEATAARPVVGLGAGRRLAALALVTGGLALIATLDATVAVGPAFVLSLAAARLVGRY